jgi:hypothetical protein
MNQHTCKNCGNSFTEEYCNRCGQKVSHRITIKHIFHDVTHAFTHADKGIFNLFLQLFIRPGKVAREYIIEGKRKKYFNPFQYILILGSIAAFVAVNSHYMENTMAVIAKPGLAYSARQLKFIHTIGTIQSKYYNFIILLQLPFVAYASFLWYRKFKINYAEHLTLQTFITAQSTFFGMIMMLAAALSGKPGVYISLTMALFNTAFQVYAYTQFFEERSFKGIMRALASAITGLLFFVLCILVIVVIAAIVVVML